MYSYDTRMHALMLQSTLNLNSTYRLNGFVEAENFFLQEMQGPGFTPMSSKCSGTSGMNAVYPVFQLHLARRLYNSKTQSRNETRDQSDHKIHETNHAWKHETDACMQSASYLYQGEKSRMIWIVIGSICHRKCITT